MTASLYSVWFVVVITMAAEFSPGLKNWLKSLTGHHWVSKSWLTIAVFILMFCVYYFMSGDASENKIQKRLMRLNVSIILGVLLILGFYLWHY